MELGVHLPLADLGQGVPTGEELRAYAATAAELGFTMLSANDHLVWRRPWLDGPTALANAAGSGRGMTLATTIALPAVRHPVVLTKALASLAVLADGPLIVGLGPGSSAADYRAVDVPFEQRWERCDEAFALIRALLRGEPAPEGTFYSVGDLRLEPLPAEPPQVWFGSWGSDTRLRRLAASADGWFASAYNTTPQGYAAARRRLDAHLDAAGRDPAAFPDAIVTAWLLVTDDEAEARAIVEHDLAPLLGREPDMLRASLPIGTPRHCLDLLRAYRDAGAKRMLLWPLRDPVAQLRRVADEVRPHLASATP